MDGYMNMLITSTGAVGGVASGVAISIPKEALINVLIFSDPYYLLFGLIGGLISMVGIINEIARKRKTEVIGVPLIIALLVKGLVLGFLFTIVSFLALNIFGNLFVEKYLAEFFGLKQSTNMSRTFWFVFTWILAYYSISIIDYISERVRVRMDKKEDEKDKMVEKIVDYINKEDSKKEDLKKEDLKKGKSDER